MKELFELIAESASNLRVNKMRTGLAILGIIIGIGSVIALVSLGQASQQAVQNQIQSLGSNLLTISPGSQSSGGVRGAMGGATTLTNADATALASSGITTIKYISPEVQSNVQLIAGKNNTNVRVVGGTEVYAEVHNLTFTSGSFFGAADNKNKSKVIVIGSEVASDLFDTDDPVGQTIRINGISFQVIGVTASKGGTGFQNQDNIAYIPLSTAQSEVFGQTYLSSIAVEATSSEVMTQTSNDIGYFLLSRHKIKEIASADFRIMSQEDILSTATSTTSTFTTLLTGVAAISLLVGGIGIMNIMLMSVTERTREIGLRKALGARKGTIITQFLIESVILTFLGGILGVCLGAIVSYLYSYFSSSIFVLSPASVVIAFFVSTAIGIIFGWYPASRASQLQPIEALRYE